MTSIPTANLNICFLCLNRAFLRKELEEKSSPTEHVAIHTAVHTVSTSLKRAAVKTF
jgi:hypothetical protein